MAQSEVYATRQEVEVLEAELKRLAVQQAVTADGLRDLTQTVARLSEDVDARFDAVDHQFRELRKEVADGHAALRKVIDDGHAAILSAILKLGPR